MAGFRDLLSLLGVWLPAPPPASVPASLSLADASVATATPTEALVSTASATEALLATLTITDSSEV